MSCQNLTVNRFDGCDRQILERLIQERRLKSFAFFLINRFAVLLAASASIAGWMGVKTMEPPRVYGDVDLVSNFHAGEIHERGIKDDALGIANLGDGLGHA